MTNFQEIVNMEEEILSFSITLSACSLAVM